MRILSLNYKSLFKAHSTKIIFSRKNETQRIPELLQLLNEANMKRERTSGLRNLLRRRSVLSKIFEAYGLCRHDTDGSSILFSRCFN